MKPAGAGDRRERESGAWDDWEGWCSCRVVKSVKVDGGSVYAG